MPTMAEEMMDLFALTREEAETLAANTPSHLWARWMPIAQANKDASGLTQEDMRKVRLGRFVPRKGK